MIHYYPSRTSFEGVPILVHTPKPCDLAELRTLRRQAGEVHHLATTFLLADGRWKDERAGLGEPCDCLAGAF